MRILPLSTLDDNRTILQEVLRVRKYLEENPCRNVFNIDESYDENTLAYDITKVFIPTDFDGTIEGGDVIIFKNSYIAVLDTVSTDYVIIKADTAVPIKGDKGDKGDTGATGKAGTNGVSITGVTKTGTSGLVDTYTITFSNGSTSTFTVTNGADGQDGATGNGISSVTKTGTSGRVDTYTITFTNGTTTTFTVTNGANGTNGVGVPTGGTTGQVLKKKSNTNYDTEWANESGGGSTKIIQLSENLLINPDFKINQRNITSVISATAQYGADRWYCPVENTTVRFNDNLAKLHRSSQIIQFVEGYPKKLNGGYLLAVVESELSENAIGKPIISIKIGNNSLRPFDGGEYIWYTDSYYGYGKYQSWVLYEIPQLGNTGAFSTSAITFVINGDSTTDSTYVSNSGLFVLDNIPSDFVSVNIPKVIPSIELEKCKYYFEYINGSNSILYTVDVNSPYSIYVQINYKNKRITPTISGGIIFKYLYNTGFLLINVVGLAETHLNYCVRNTLGNADNEHIHGIIFNKSSLIVDAEIYP